MVAVGTGLAYAHVGGDEDHLYELLHLASGLAAICGIETEAAAQRLVELAAPLTDWMQESQAICALGPGLAQRLRAMLQQAEKESEGGLKRFLRPEQGKRIEQIARDHQWSIGDVIDEALDAWLDAESDEESPFLEQVQHELDRACEKHPPLHSLHEAYAVILEKVDELKAEIWKQQDARDFQAIRRELSQIAAMCARTVEDGLVESE
jgi:hypothetical protein